VKNKSTCKGFFLRLLIVLLIFLIIFVMKKMNFEQMENIQGGLDWCFIGKGITGLGLVAIAGGASFTCGGAAIAYGVIAGATTIFC
jgi:hypothetical protein